MTLNDNSLMPWGKHKGEKMANVPASYLLWLFDNGKCCKDVKDYIVKNKEELKIEANK